MSVVEMCLHGYSRAITLIGSQETVRARTGPAEDRASPKSQRGRGGAHKIPPLVESYQHLMAAGGGGRFSSGVAPKAACVPVDGSCLREDFYCCEKLPYPRQLLNGNL